MEGNPFDKIAGPYGKASRSERDDIAFFLKVALKTLTLPLWLPFWLAMRYRTRRRMILLCDHWEERGLSCREMAVRWAELHPDEYPFGEYDPRVRKLEARFRKLLEK